MTKEEILEFARKSGIDVAWLGRDHSKYADACVKFAELVSQQELQECMELVKPTRERPCDCEYCDCGNTGNQRDVDYWDADNWAYKAIKRKGEVKNDA